MNRYTLVALSLAGGIVSGLAWSNWCPGLVLLFSLVPFLLIENHLFNNQKRFNLNDLFIYLLPGFVVLNMITLGWVRAANITAAVIIILGLSTVMAFVMWLAHLVRIKAGNFSGALAFITFWLSFEFLSLNTVYLSPWMNLGNGLAKDIQFIQWYEFTGVGGGTLWILMSNLLLASFIMKDKKGQPSRKVLIFTWLSVMILPISISLIRYHTIKPETSESSGIVIIQPNIDPFTEKYTIPFETQLERVISAAEKELTADTDWMITPETTVDDPVDENNIADNRYFKMLRDFAVKNHDLNIVTGMVSYRLDPEPEHPLTRSDEKIDTSGFRIDHFNSAFRIDSGSDPDIYRKSKLVAGIEREFSAAFGRLINRIAPELGGTAWGYGTQDKRTSFRHSSNGHRAGPVICYESVFGSFVAATVREGAEVLFIITNDGWWKNTNGYKQHLNYASLRAIETRRQVARAANTGISCITDIRGNRLTETEWWKESVIRGEIHYQKSLTPYVKYGDYLMRIASVIAVLLALYIFVTLPFRRKLFLAASD